MSPRPLVALAFALLAVSTRDDVRAAGNDGATCISAFEDAQRARTTQRLLAAREALVVCSRATCPKVVANQCQKWRDAVEAAVPTIKLSIVDAAGQPASGAKVAIDDRPTVVPDDGVITLDPGPHGVRATLARSKPAEARFELKPGEKGRPVALRLEADGSPASAATTSATASSTAPTGDRSIPTASYVLGGVGIVAIGVFAYLGLSARRDERTLSSTCAPACSPDDVSSLRTKYVEADVALGVGVLSLGIATWLALSSSDAPVSVGVGPTGAVVRGRF